ncbi:MAG TPA: tetratricopeptide repeat protein, partial [Methanotrichaceae archaeon]|nr:tetratricopeptide repeat protein [Methanotrichaceae archaeon]
MGAQFGIAKGNPWYERAIYVTFIGSILIIIGNLGTGILPILFNDSDFCLNIDSVSVEAVPIDESDIFQEDIETLHSNGKKDPQANIVVKNSHKYIKKYDHQVYLKDVQANPDIIDIDFDPAGGEPTFSSNISVTVRNSSKSLKNYPVTIQAEGGDGKKRNCSIYINYNSPKDLVHKGLKIAKEGGFIVSLDMFNRAIQIDPRYALAWYYKGTSLRELENFKEAIQAYDEAIRLDPKVAWPWNGKGIAFRRQGEYDKAIQAYDEAIRLDPEFAMAWNNKGNALERLGEYDDAIRAYDEAIRLDPDYALPWNGKGYALEKQGKYDEAIQAWDEAIKLNPTSAWPWNGKGNA